MQKLNVVCIVYYFQNFCIMLIQKMSERLDIKDKIYFNDQNQNSLLVQCQNDNIAPGALGRED